VIDVPPAGAGRTVTLRKIGALLTGNAEPRRHARKPSLTSRLKAAHKAGAKDVDIRPDGTVTAAFGTEPYVPIENEWDTDLGIDKLRGH
jgi:hypothetical protein